MEEKKPTWVRVHIDNTGLEEEISKVYKNDADIKIDFLTFEGFVSISDLTPGGVRISEVLIPMSRVQLVVNWYL